MIQETTTERLPYDTETLDDPGIDLVAVFVALLGQWRVALIAFVVVLVPSLLYVNSLKPQYVATATFLPSQGRTEAASLASIFEARGPGTLYIGLLNSRSVQNYTIDRAHLLDAFGIHDYEIARYILASKSHFVLGTDSIITISVRDQNAQMAANIANAYLEGLQDLNDKMAQAQAAQTRKFYDRQLKEQQDLLDKAEDEFIDLQEKTGQVAPGSQAAIGIGNIAGLRQQIVGLQVQLSVLERSETPENPDVMRVQQQIAGLQAQERAAEAGQGIVPAGAATPASRIPTMARELDKAQANVTGHSALVTSLGSQSQLARLDETFSHPAFEVIDSAVPPEFRAWPPRTAYIGACFGGAALAALFAAVVRLILQRIFSNPKHRASIRRLRGAF